MMEGSRQMGQYLTCSFATAFPNPAIRSPACQCEIRMGERELVLYRVSENPSPLPSPRGKRRSGESPLPQNGGRAAHNIQGLAGFYNAVHPRLIFGVPIMLLHHRT